jgi:hypothetical protein
MARASPAIVAFDAGEFAPQMEGRIDVEKYPRAAHIQQNMIALKQGPSTFRPGNVYVQPVKNSANRSWLRRFEFSQTQAFVLEFGDRYVRFYTNHGPLLSTGNPAYNGATAYVVGNQVVSLGITYYCIAPTTGNAPPNAAFWYPLAPYQGSATVAIYEIPSPYAVADLTDSLGQFTLQINQSGDVLYIAAGQAVAGPSGVGYPPFTLTRFANAPPDWAFQIFAPTDGPYADGIPIVPNAEIALTVVAAGPAFATTGSTVGIQAYGGNVFAATDIGRLVRIGSQQFNVTPWSTNVAWLGGTQCSNNGNNYTALANGTSGGSPPVQTAGIQADGPNVGTNINWLYTDSGYGVAQITGYTNPTTVTAVVLKTFPANVIGVQAAITAITQAAPAVVSAVNTFKLGQPIFITAVNGMAQVNNTVMSAAAVSGATVTLANVNSTAYGAYTSGGVIVSNASTEWQLGAWSNSTEWPRALAFYKDRLWWAGKFKAWGSVPGLYNSHAPDFFGQQTTDSAVNILVSGSDAVNIVWLLAANILLVGTQGGEYGIDAANYSSSPLGPSNIECLRQSQWRCRPIAPELVGTSVLYAQRAGRKIFAMDYNFYLNRYDSTDQSKFAYHATIGGLNGIAFQQEPWSILWGWRTDGTFLSYTFNREDNVTAWCRHNMGNGGIVESMAVIPAPDGLRDEYWAIVNRTVNGAVIRTVEYSAKAFEGPQAGNLGDAQSSAWYVDCGVQVNLAATDAITGVVSAFSLFHGGSGNTQYQCINNFVVGQAVFVSGVQYTGTFNPNVQGALITGATPTSFTILQNIGPGGTFNYLSGGAASVGAAGGQTINNLPPVMWNQTVNILADGAAQPQQVVSGTGSITLAATFNVVTIGFPYQGNLVPMRIEGGADVGTAQGKIKQGANLVLRLIDTYGATVSQLSNINPTTGAYQDPLGLSTLIANNPEPVMLNYTTTGLDVAPPIQSGDFPISFPAQAVSDQDASDFYILVQQNLPLPMTIAGLFPSYKVEERQ